MEYTFNIIFFSEFGEVSDEVTIITQTAMLSSFVGLVYGGFINSRTAYMDFMRQNTASSFTSHFEAKVSVGLFTISIVKLSVFVKFVREVYL